MANPQTPLVRQQFAERLKSLRLARGFRTARSLAVALEIDENRYTRYERAEVEPDLDLLSRICSALQLSPNDLLGPLGDGGRAKVPGFAEEAVSEPADGPDLRRDRAAWRLAQAVAEIESCAGRPQAASPAPLSVLQSAGRWFLGLQSKPYAAMSELLCLPSVAGLPPPSAERLRQAVEAFSAELEASSRRND
jgi:transcriptional regulator with XRE-family HTH domain